MPSRSVLFRRIALSGYLGLLLLIPSWIFYFSPPEMINPWALLAIWWGPLLFPLRGILRGRDYTFAWSGFLMVIYFCHGVMVAMVDPSESRLGMAETLLSLMMLLGGMLYIKYKNAQQSEQSSSPK